MFEPQASGFGGESFSLHEKCFQLDGFLECWVIYYERVSFLSPPFFIYAVYGRWEIIGGSIPLTSTKKIPIATTGEWLIFKSSLTYWRQRKESKKEFWRLTIDDITPRLTYVLVLTIRDYSRTQYAYKLFTKNVKDQQRDIRLAKAVVANR